MIEALFFATAAAYGIASALLLAYLGGAAERPSVAALGALGVAAVLHVVHDGLRWGLTGVGPFAGIAPALSTLAALVVVGLLVVRRMSRRLEVVGALVTPAALAFFLASRTHAGGAAVHGALFAVHISSNLVGVAAFTLACGLAVAYLLQERQVKARNLGALFRRLPPLEVLDRYAYRCIVVGLPALTLGLITGHVAAARGPHARGLPWQQYFAMVSWALFVGVLLLRAAAGWRGRRAAIGTILGYASALIVLLFYAARGGAA